MCYSPLVAKNKTEFNIINFLALYWKCACVGPIFFKMHSQNVFISQEKNNRFPLLDMLGYLKNTYTLQNLAKWDKSQPGNSQPSPLFGTLMGILKYPKISKNGNLLFFPVYKEVSGAPLWTQKQHIFGQWFAQKKACPQCVWSHCTLSHSSWYFKTHSRQSDTRSFADH